MLVSLHKYRAVQKAKRRESSSPTVPLVFLVHALLDSFLSLQHGFQVPHVPVVERLSSHSVLKANCIWQKCCQKGREQLVQNGAGTLCFKWAQLGCGHGYKAKGISVPGRSFSGSAKRFGLFVSTEIRDHKYSLKIRERTYLNFWCLPTFCTLMFLNGFVLIVQAQPFISELYKLVFVNLITLSSFPCAFF